MQKNLRKLTLLFIEYLPLLVILIIGIIMLRNTFAYPVRYSYDYSAHMQSLKYIVQTDHEFPVLPAHFKYAYNPPLYYYIFGKIHMLLQYFSSNQFNPYYTFRLFHLVIYLGLGYLYIYKLLPKYIKDKRLWLALALLFATVPNFYLSQLMVRADHLTFLALGSLFYLWYYYDYEKYFSKSLWRILAWAVLLIILANSRHFAIVGYTWFFGYGVYLLTKDLLLPKKIKILPKLLVIGCLFFIILGSGYYYIFQYSRGSNPIGWSAADTYSDKYKSLEKKRTFKDKLQMAGNLEFNKLFRTPNRKEIYGPKNNAYFPRVYGDMWADHWLYFSGGPNQDKETIYKQIVLILAIPFTILYFGSTIYFSWEGLLRLKNKKSLLFYHTASILFLGVFVLMTVYTNFFFSEFGKNSIVKFAYLLGYSIFPFLGMVEILNRKKGLILPFLAYLVILFIACLPLLIY